VRGTSHFNVTLVGSTVAVTVAYANHPSRLMPQPKGKDVSR
jgi:hypothetical protein